MSSMIPGISLVWKMVTELVNGYSSDKKDILTIHVEPIHSTMLEIHKDYISGFQDALKHIKNKEIPPSQVIEFLKQRRRDYEAQRDLAEKLALEFDAAPRRVIGTDTWANIKGFCSAVVDYFIADSNVTGLSWYSFLIDDVESKVNSGLYTSVWDTGAIYGDPRHELEKGINQALNVGLPEALSRINRYYAALKRQLVA